MVRKTDARQRFEELFTEVFRVLRTNAHFYMFCDPETAFIAKPIAERCGFHFWKPLIWDKESIGLGYHYRSQYEFVLFFEKGKRNFNDLSIGDVLPAKRIRGGYPTEKPIAISEVLIRQSTSPLEVVLIPSWAQEASASLPGTLVDTSAATT